MSKNIPQIKIEEVKGAVCLGRLPKVKIFVNGEPVIIITGDVKLEPGADMTKHPCAFLTVESVLLSETSEIVVMEKNFITRFFDLIRSCFSKNRASC